MQCDNQRGQELIKLVLKLFKCHFDFYLKSFPSFITSVFGLSLKTNYHLIEIR